MTIMIVKAALASIGIGHTLRWMKRRIGLTSTAENIPDDRVRMLEYTVALAAALYPGRAMCLERSLALFYLARRHGIPVTYHHGVQPLPFKAHAWVEYHGLVINDVQEHIDTYRRLPQVCP
jgi:hypothetical protein